MVLSDQLMELVQNYKYLGVVVSSDLSWSKHIQLICVKAKKILGLLHRNLQNTSMTPVLYKALVRPHSRGGNNYALIRLRLFPASVNSQASSTQEPPLADTTLNSPMLVPHWLGMLSNALVSLPVRFQPERPNTNMTLHFTSLVG